jgi:spore coat polysaccharide biosynthesis protein SpsF
MSNVVGIIQSRMDSRRFPKKMSAKLKDATIIEWILKRVLKSKKLDKIVLATTRKKSDNFLVSAAKDHQVSVFRGESEDVLDRYYKAAKFYKANIIVRICGDNPFIDPNMIDKLIQNFASKKYDYGFNHQSRLNFKCVDGFGAEIFNFKTLDKINSDEKSIKIREHVTLSIWKNKLKYKIQPVYSGTGLNYPKIKFDVNTKRDLANLNRFLESSDINIRSNYKSILKSYLKFKKNEFKNTNKKY